MRAGQIDYGPVADCIDTRGGLAEALAAAEIERDSTQGERIRRSYSRSLERGYGGVFHVDEVCCVLLRKHPTELYGPAWYNPKTTTPSPRTPPAEVVGVIGMRVTEDGDGEELLAA